MQIALAVTNASLRNGIIVGFWKIILVKNEKVNEGNIISID